VKYCRDCRLLFNIPSALKQQMCLAFLQRKQCLNAWISLMHNWKWTVAQLWAVAQLLCDQPCIHFFIYYKPAKLNDYWLFWERIPPLTTSLMLLHCVNRKMLYCEQNGIIHDCLKKKDWSSERVELLPEITSPFF